MLYRKLQKILNFYSFFVIFWDDKIGFTGAFETKSCAMLPVISDAVANDCGLVAARTKTFCVRMMPWQVLMVLMIDGDFNILPWESWDRKENN